MPEILWKDRKRTLFGKPWSFTKYSLTEDKLVIESGFLRKKEEEVRLYRILDITLKRSLRQRIWGLGTVHCCSADRSSPEFNILSVKKSSEVKNLLSDLVEACRDRKRVSTREYMDDDGEEEMNHV